MSLQMTITVQGDKQTIQRIQKLGKSLLLMHRALKEIGDELKDFYSGQVFDSQGAAIGSRWKPLNARYARQKARKHPGTGSKINYRTGKTQKSFYVTATQTQATIGNSSPQFEYLQLGTRRMPARPIMAVKKNGRLLQYPKSIINRIIKREINRKLLEAGL